MALALAASQVHATAPLPPFWQTPLFHVSKGVQDGAPPGIFSISQTDDGWIWLRSTAGLYRYDGVQFEAVDAIHGNKLQSTSIGGVYASGNRIFVSYQFGGLSLFEGKTVRHFKPEDGLPVGAIWKIGATTDGTVWIAGLFGFAYFEQNRWHPVPVNRTAQRNGGDMVFDRQGGVLAWFLDTGELYYCAPGRREFELLLERPGVELMRPYVDGTIWLKHHDAQIWEFTPSTKQLRALPLKGQNFRPDQRGGMWVSDESGMQLYDRDLQPRQAFRGAQRFNSDVFYIFEDREANTWFGSAAGIDMVRQNKLHPIDLSREWVMLSLAVDGDGAIWVNNNNTTAAPPSSFTVMADGSRVTAPVTQVQSSYTDPDGVVWYGNNVELRRFDKGSVTTYPLPPEVKGAAVQTMTRGPDGKLWVAIVRNGIYSFDDGKWQAGAGGTDMQVRVLSMLNDGRGRLLLGYASGKVSVLERGSLRHIETELGAVITLYARNGHLWAGGENGLAYLDGDHFVPLRDSDGKNFLKISGIVESAAGELWLHGVQGVTHIAAPALRQAMQDGGGRVAAERFDYRDGHAGMPALIRPTPTLVEAGDGRIWYATDSSVGWIDPAHIGRNPLPPPVEIRRVRSDGQELALVDNLLSLAAGHNSMQIDYTALSFSAPERVRFRYRLEGVDRDWVDAGGSRSASYTQLSPGRYRFQVIAANEDGLWNQQGATMEVDVAPTLTQTWWFRSLLALALAGGLWMLHRYRLRAAEEGVRRRIEERIGERGRIARELHDTLLQSMQSVILKIHAVALSLAPEQPQRKEIGHIVDAAQQALAEGRDKVHDLRGSLAAAVDLRQLLGQFGDKLRQQGAPEGLVFEVEMSGDERPLHPVSQDDVAAIGREALLNAFRHAGAAAITLALSYGEREFRMEVRDHGCGIPAEVLASGGRDGHWGLLGMRERAEKIGGRLQIHSEPGKGTTISFALPAALAYRAGKRGWRG